MTARVEKLIRPAQKLSEWEKEKYVHDFICENIRYDKLKKSYSHEIIGPLGQGVGVCEGIAKVVKVLLDALGVWCVIAICGNNPEKGIKYRHTWNIVKIGGAYYHLDATFDNTLGKDRETSEIRYDYFNLDDSQIFRDHEPLIAPAPHCGDHEHFYYKEKKLSFTKKEAKCAAVYWHCFCSFSEAEWLFSDLYGSISRQGILWKPWKKILPLSDILSMRTGDCGTLMFILIRGIWHLDF